MLTVYGDAAGPCVFLDNFNAKNLTSDILASALTENPAMVRVFGHTKNVPLFTKTFIGITGNGVQVAEDMARRLLVCRLDSQMENPELRPFKAGFLDSVFDRRSDLLTACLTIWRWGRQNEIQHGKPLGNYEVWGEWCRDPLLALGCADPVERIIQIKATDPKRLQVQGVYEMWWVIHKGEEVRASEIGDEVKRLIDPNATTGEDGKLKASRQRIAGWLGKHIGTRVGGYWLEEIKDEAGYRATTTYRLMRSESKPPRQEVVFGNGSGAVANDNFQTATTTNDWREIVGE